MLGHLQAIPKRQTFTVEIISHTPPRQIGAMAHTPKNTQKIPTSAPDETASGITIGEPTLPRRAGLGNTVPKIQSTKPITRNTRNSRNQNATTMDSTRSPRTTRNSNTGHNPNSRLTLIAGRNHRRNANIGSGGGRNQRRNVNLG